MLASRWPDVFVDPAWVFEFKWDGVRAIVTTGAGPLNVKSRAGNDATRRYPELGGFVPDRPVVLDGEIVAFDPKGRPSFEHLQQRMNLSGEVRIADAVKGVPISFVVFDILHDGVPLISLPWEQRHERLCALDLPAPYEIPDHVRADPSVMWRLVRERGIEGIVAKRIDSVYRPGQRSPDWRKITAFRQARAVVAGYLPGEGGRSRTFGSLLLGLWTPDGLRWVGAVGSGFDDTALGAIRGALDAMHVESSPFLPHPDMPRNAVFVEPRLVALVQYKEFTSVGRLRGPSFKGFTDDDMTLVTWDREGPGAPG